MAAAVLVRADGQLAEPKDLPLTAQALLASLVDGARDGGDARDSGDGATTAATYTTALALWSGTAYEVVDWHLHAERLARDCCAGADPSSLAAQRAALALDALSRSAGGDSGPPRAAMLVVAVWGGSASSVVAYAKTAPPYAQQQQPDPPPPLRVVAAVGSGGRQRASAKRCAWVVERRALESWAAGKYDEVLLVDDKDDDTVLEGLVSNFYAIVKREEEKGGEEGDGAPSDNDNDSAPNNLSSLVLQTASSPNALPGVVQQRVFEAAARLGLAVESGGGGPSLAALRRGRCREALVSNCLRGLAPVASVAVRRYKGDGGGGEDYDVTLHPQGPVGRLLMKEVLALQRRERLPPALAAEE
jgi:branched-subunit amino acid aminotransferase/4-amino-4-deoxychorismate lyase